MARGALVARCNLFAAAFLISNQSQKANLHAKQQQWQWQHQWQLQHFVAQSVICAANEFRIH